jgi:queuine/archaeosine tRNA-ribosyltransferase
MNYPNLPKDCTSLLCKYLSRDIFEELKDKTTVDGFTLLGLFSYHILHGYSQNL